MTYTYCQKLTIILQLHTGKWSWHLSVFDTVELMLKVDALPRKQLVWNRPVYISLIWVFFLSRTFVTCNQHKHFWFLVSISIRKLLTTKHPSWASDLVLSIKNAPKCCAYREALGFWRLLLNMLGETSSRVFSKKEGLGIFRNISVRANAKLYFFLLQAVVRLDFLLKCNKDSSSCHSYTTPLCTWCRSDWIWC